MASKIPLENEKRCDVLIIENDSDVIDLLVYYFQFKGIRAKGFLDGLNLINLVLESTPKMVILEAFLPFTNGLELCMQIKRNTKTREVKVYFLTTYPKEHVEKLVASVHADGYIVKPFNMAMLDELATKL